MSKKVLIVEDEPEIVETLREFFTGLDQGHAYEVTAAHDGADAIRALLRVRYDLILLDMHMPRMGGLELLKQMRRENVRVPVLMVTSNQDTEAAAEALRAGVFAYVPKPFDFPLVALALSTVPPDANRRA